MQLPPPQSIDPNVPAQIPADQLQDFKGFLDVAPDVLTLGHQLWGGLAAIVVAWSGLKIAFSGTFEPWSLVRVVLGIAIPRTLLHYYSVPIPGVGFTFPAMVAAGGIWLQNLFISDVVSVGYMEMTALVQAFAARLGAAWSGGSLMTLMTEGVNVFFSSLVALMMGVPLVLGLVALFCLTYAQVIWAQVALAIVILLGPVFIPWLLFEPLAFLFWGWFRTLMVYTLYGVVAGAILRVFMGVGMGYVTTYTGALMGTGSSDPAELGLWVVVVLPLVVSGLMAGMKVGELAAMLVSGSGSVGSGMMAPWCAAAGASPLPRTRPAPQSPEAEGDIHEPRTRCRPRVRGDLGRDHRGEPEAPDAGDDPRRRVPRARRAPPPGRDRRAASPDRRAGRRGRPRRGRGLRGRNGAGGSARSHDQVLPEPANYSVTCCYACGYPVADTLWITSAIQNERAAAAGIVPFIFCGRDRFLRLLALGVSEAIVSRTLQLVGSLYL